MFTVINENNLHLVSIQISSSCIYVDFLINQKIDKHLKSFIPICWQHEGNVGIFINLKVDLKIEFKGRI